MAISISLVDGPGFAEEASRILEEAWEPPAPRYTSAYLRWQLSFPSAVELPAFAAFDGRELVGFAGAAARRLRHGCTDFDAAVVSFVAVRPGWRGQGVAGGLYSTLLKELADREVPVVTFAILGSAGDRTLLRAYPKAGFQMRALGTYSSFAGLRGKADGEWTARFSEDAEALAAVAEQVAAGDPRGLWSMPGSGQTAHYFTDPRPRKLIIVEHAGAGVRAAGFVVHSELRTLRGIERVTTLDSLWMTGVDTDGFGALLELASAAWPSSGDSSSVVMCPNLGGFEASCLKAAGLRKTGAQFAGYFCVPGKGSWLAPEWTNLEIV